jgi:hypothetical protein
LGPTGPTGPTGVSSGDNFIFASDSTSYNIPGISLSAPFDTNRVNNGWTHVPNSVTFTCNQTGKYLIQFRITVRLYFTGGTEKLRAYINPPYTFFSNRVEINAGWSGLDDRTVTLRDTMILDATAGSTFTVSGDRSGIVNNPFQIVAFGAGTTLISAAVTFVRIL